MSAAAPAPSSFVCKPPAAGWFVRVEVWGAIGVVSGLVCEGTGGAGDDYKAGQVCVCLARATKDLRLKYSRSLNKETLNTWRFW